jgi:N-succinyldiaminopimelate aminotransferase
MNPDIATLQPYPFERLAALKQGTTPPAQLPHIALSIGEPRHPAPAVVTRVLAQQLGQVAHYPTTRGTPALREAIAEWLAARFQLGQRGIDPDSEILPVNGTREALFAIAQALVDRREQDALVLMPNPFYQIYEGAALLAGAQPWYLNCTADNGYIPDFDGVPEAIWRRCQLLYICTPGNPSGAVLDLKQLGRLLELAEQYDFVIASDECYSEIYPHEQQAPPGLLQAAAALGIDDFRRCLVFHSLSKRSNLPGLRSGFVAGDRQLIDGFFRYRTYHGCAMPLQVQMASIAAWRDEQHVHDNRTAYRAKFQALSQLLAGQMDFSLPDAGFYLWARTPGDDAQFARALFEQCHVSVLPGTFLGREQDGINPGSGHVRMALVANMAQCVDAAERLRGFLDHY